MTTPSFKPFLDVSYYPVKHKPRISEHLSRQILTNWQTSVYSLFRPS